MPRCWTIKNQKSTIDKTICDIVYPGGNRVNIFDDPVIMMFGDVNQDYTNPSNETLFTECGTGIVYRVHIELCFGSINSLIYEITKLIGKEYPDVFEYNSRRITFGIDKSFAKKSGIYPMIRIRDNDVYLMDNQLKIFETLVTRSYNSIHVVPAPPYSDRFYLALNLNRTDGGIRFTKIPYEDGMFYSDNSAIYGITHHYLPHSSTFMHGMNMDTGHRVASIPKAANSKFAAILPDREEGPKVIRIANNNWIWTVNKDEEDSFIAMCTVEDEKTKEEYVVPFSRIALNNSQIIAAMYGLDFSKSIDIKL